MICILTFVLTETEARNAKNVIDQIILTNGIIAGFKRLRKKKKLLDICT